MKITLLIYNAVSTQWSGKFIVDGVEIGGVAGCSSSDQVEQMAIEQGYEIIAKELCKSFIQLNEKSR